MQLNSQVVITADLVDFSLLIIEIIMLLTAAVSSTAAVILYAVFPFLFQNDFFYSFQNSVLIHTL